LKYYNYEITIKGQLSEKWEDYFEGLQISPLNPKETLLSGCMPDQAALHGILMMILNLCLELISVKRIEVQEGSLPNVQ